jgi:hypothetical protein
MMNCNRPRRRQARNYPTPDYLTVYEMGRIGVGVLRRVLAELGVEDLQAELTIIERRVNERERSADGHA